MQFGPLLGEACGTFALTNIDDIFVLVTFFAEAATGRSSLTPLKVTAGQHLGFTVILMISMIGYAVALVLPAEPIGFLGLLPVILGLWNLCDLVIPKPEEGGGEETSRYLAAVSSIRAISKVGLVTLMNGGDNISLYIPLFSQLKGPEIAVYVVTYYVLLGAYCAVAWLIMKQKHVLRLAQKYVHFVIPLLYVGLGVYIIVKSHCYPWTVQQIDDATAPDPGVGIMAGVTAFVLLASVAVMVTVKWQKKRNADAAVAEGTTADVDLDREGVSRESVDHEGEEDAGGTGPSRAAAQ